MRCIFQEKILRNPQALYVSRTIEKFENFTHKKKTKQNKCNFYPQNWFKISNNFKERYERNILRSKLTDGVAGTLAGLANLADFAGTVALGLAGTAKFLLEAACKCIAVCLMLSLTNLSMIDLNHPESKINIS